MRTFCLTFTACGIMRLALIVFATLDSASAATLEVGPGKQFSRIEEANAKAQAGDVILVYPPAGGRPYDATAVFVRQKNLTFRGVPGAAGPTSRSAGKGSTTAAPAARPGPSSSSTREPTTARWKALNFRGPQLQP